MCNPPLLGSLIVRKIVCTIPSLVYSSHWALQYLFLLCQSVLFCPSPARQTQLEHKSFLMASCRTWLWIFFLLLFSGLRNVNAGGKGGVLLLLCAVLLHYASCDPTMSCILGDDVRVRQTCQCVWTFFTDSTWKKKKFAQCCTVTVLFTSSQLKEQRETPFFFSSPRLCGALTEAICKIF